MVIPTTESTLRITLIRLSEEKLKLIEVTRERDEARGQVENQKERIGEFFAALEKLISELAEARGQLAEIEDKMRVELGGHPDSELWGEAGLIAATMRCVDALGEVTDQRDEARAEMIRWMSIAEGRGRTDDDDTGKAIAKLIRQRDEARGQRDRMAEVIEAACVLIAAKGRHNTMLAYNGLQDALQSLNQPEQ